jgi:hypothetical protein
MNTASAPTPAELYKPTHLNRWTLPDSYAGEVWPDYFVFLGRHRDSDVLTNCNFDVSLEHLAKLPAFEDEHSRTAIRESHWAVGWVEWIAIHADDTDALKAADEMAAHLADYPVLNEEAFSNAEQEEAEKVWRDCYNAKERLEYVRKHRSQFEFRDWQDLLGCIRGRYFAGYASELIA